jgi:hypothetical protein
MKSILFWITLLTVGIAAMSNAAEPLPKDEGYRGLWYSNQPSGDEYKFKYSGGLGTYPQQHHPIAYYSEEANKTFFCYGGTLKGKQELLHMVSYYDHATGKIPRPRILLNKKTSDAHDNPTIMLDDDGYVWVFSNAHGTSRPSYIHRSVEPYSIDAFGRVLETNFSYSQPWHIPGLGFLFLHTKYAGGRELRWMTSPDGWEWSEPKPLAHMDQGHYQVSWRHGTKVGTAFNYHPKEGGLNSRTNLYYVESDDFGKTWRNVEGATVERPLTTVKNPALVHDYESEGLLCYLKEVNFETDGKPVILFLTSKGYASGPQNDPRIWKTARWTGNQWDIHVLTRSDNNYDFGSLYIEEDGTWRVIGTTEPGPQRYNTGGEVAMWLSMDRGETWKKEKQLTRDSEWNHTYPRRPVNANPGFYALWADGHGREMSDSRLYFTNRTGEHVWRLPAEMTEEFAEPEVVW